MGSRIPPRTRDELSPEEQEEYDQFSKQAEFGFGKNGEKFIYKADDGAFVGPFPFLIAASETGRLALELVYSIGRLPLPAAAKEVAILVCGAHYQGSYELYAHINVSTKTGVLSEKQATEIAQGKKPDNLSSECSLAYDIAKRLLTTPGPLPQEDWNKSVETFGKTGTVALVHYIGFYAYLSIALNAVDVPVPESQ